MRALERDLLVLRIDGRTTFRYDTVYFDTSATSVRASIDQGVSSDVIAPVQALIRRQIAAGHGKEGFARIYEELRSTS